MPALFVKPGLAPKLHQPGTLLKLAGLLALGILLHCHRSDVGDSSVKLLAADMQRLHPETHSHDLRLQMAAQSAAADCEEEECDLSLPLWTAVPLEVDPQLQIALSEDAVQCTAWCTDFARTAAEGQQCLERCLQHPGMATWQHSLQQQAASAHTRPSCSQGIHFVAYYAVGERGSEGHARDQLATPSMHWVSAVQKSHPNALVTVITDQTTQLAVPSGVQLFRFPINKTLLGRNAWANYFQYQAQTAFLLHLHHSGQASDVVFMDTDILVVDDLATAFCQEFDYALTLSDAVDMPINIGMQFVRSRTYLRAANFLQSMLLGYNLTETFVAGQIAIAEHLGIMNNSTAVHSLLDRAVRRGAACMEVPDATHSSGAGFRVCLLPCALYNYCNMDQSCCTDPGRRLPFALDSPTRLQQARPKALHFVGHRKIGLEAVHSALINGSLLGVYQEWDLLPHDQSKYDSYGQRRQLLEQA